MYFQKGFRWFFDTRPSSQWFVTFSHQLPSHVGVVHTTVSFRYAAVVIVNWSNRGDNNILFPITESNGDVDFSAVTNRIVNRIERKTPGDVAAVFISFQNVFFLARENVCLSFSTMNQNQRVKWMNEKTTIFYGNPS